MQEVTQECSNPWIGQDLLASKRGFKTGGALFSNGSDLPEVCR
jgi:hypothetical protein